MKPKKLDQIEIFPRRGGRRNGAGRPTLGKTTTIRIPLEFLNVVTEIKNGTYTPAKSADLNTVTEIKDDESAAQAIHALRQYFRAEYMMGESDVAFESWIKNTLEQQQ